MRALILITIILGAFVALTLGSKHATSGSPTSSESAAAIQWVTTTDPHQDPQVSPAPPIKAPPRR